MFEQAFKNIDDVLWKEAGCASAQRKHAALTALFRTLLHQLMTAHIPVHGLDLPQLGIATQG